MMKNLHQLSRKASERRAECVSMKAIEQASSSIKHDLIKLAVDTHGSYYVVGRMIDNVSPQPGQKMSPLQFLKFAEKQKSLARRVVVVYEAGPFGYHLARQLQALAIECLVVAAQNWDERNKRTRTDRTDTAAMLSRLDRYLAGNKKALAVVRIPTVQEELTRDLTSASSVEPSRHRNQFRKEKQRWISRGRSLLHRYGINRPSKWWQDLRGKEIHQELTELHGESAALVIVGMLEEYREAITLLEIRLKDLTERLSKSWRDRKIDRPLAVGELSCEQLTREIVDWNRFSNRRQVASYTGLCPGREQSGSSDRELSVNKCGNPRVRAILVESAWLLPRWQPKYKPLIKYQWLFQKEKPAGTRSARKKAIVALARRLAVDLWRLFTGRTTAEKLGLKLAT
jgi:transposase